MNNAVSVLITGGSGFVGSRLIREILDGSEILSADRIVVFDLVPPPEDLVDRVEYIQGDICDLSALGSAIHEIDVVFHVAAIVDWGTKSPSEVRRVNVDGTDMVTRVCLENSVRVLIATSSLDATFGGKELLDASDDVRYPERHPNMYCQSKMEAEQIVCAAHGSGLLTCCLRPADVYGEGDPYHMPPLLDMVRSGFYVRIGDGSARSQHCYVGNVAAAHLQAAAAFLKGTADHGGRSWFITDGEPANFFTFFDGIVSGAGYRIRPRNLRIPFWLFYLMGALVETFTLPIRPFLKRAPRISRFAAVYTCTTYTFRSDGARRAFGFAPKFTEEEAVSSTIEYYRSE